MMSVNRWMGIAATFLLLLAGCEKETGPDLTGEITLSSQLFGTENYYLYGFSFEEGEMYRYPNQGELLPDIINEGYLLIEGDAQISLPGFNTPERLNGFAIAGEFSSWGEAKDFYDNYEQVEEGLLYETLSDIVKLNQVWVQKTPAGKYVKMVIREINQFEPETGGPYNEVTLEYTYAADGSTGFTCGCN